MNNNNTTLPANVRAWLADPLSHDARALITVAATSPGVSRVAVMPDAHPADAVCNGCVIAVSDRIYPQAVGQDIGCGFTAVMLASDPIFDLPREIGEQILATLTRAIPSVRHGKKTVADLAEIASTGELTHASLSIAAARDGLVQLGTLGRGNHFVELQRNDEGALWLMVHSGSRAMGRSIYDYTLRHTTRDTYSPLSFLHADASAANEYLQNAAWATRYAAANRKRILTLTCHALAANFEMAPIWPTLIDSPHNTITIEAFGGQPHYIHRKGAARSLVDDIGIIAGSAGTFSVHTQGRACEDALNSCSHGAGRVFSRSEAHARITTKELVRSMHRVTFDTANARRLIEEAPSAYRDLRVVLEAQRDLVRITRRVTPLVSFKAV